ncbi:MAG: NUDIX domain-containing protein [Bacteroidota bacterium]
MTKHFNIRVYGILLHNNKILVNEELIKGNKFIKFPGGGMEMGEGTIDCLKREWMEELSLDIEVLDHFYTTDYFQQSAFDGSQIISIYYWVTSNSSLDNIANNIDGEITYWLDIYELKPDTFSLPIDKKVGQMLMTLFPNRPR